MKPFNLSDAIAGKPVVTRDGREVTQLHLFDLKKERYCVCGVLDDSIYFFDENGCCGAGGEDTSEDLFMKSNSITKWANIYRKEKAFETGVLYDTEEIAKASSASTVFTTIPITFEI